jgi:hypothetical protein
MGYVLMLLADPGPPGQEIPDPGTPRAEVLAILNAAPDLRVDGSRPDRYWLKVGEESAELNLGSKDPVGSIHLEFESDDPQVMEAFALRALELAAALRMRVEDVLWGREVTREHLPELREFWRAQSRPEPAQPAAPPKPWWRFW